jgi:hypothetical protein
LLILKIRKQLRCKKWFETMDPEKAKQERERVTKDPILSVDI